MKKENASLFIFTIQEGEKNPHPGSNHLSNIHHPFIN